MTAMIERAAAFAEKAHRGAFRKGTNIPYITHPMETAVIVSAFTDDPEIIAAALLHDVVEDSGITGEELETAFGRRVMELVMLESEDKTKTWKERKCWTVRRLCTASMEVKMIALGDKLSNMRCTARDYLVLGDAVWQRFNEKDKEKQAWYYWQIAFALKELENHVYYKEYVLLCKSVFGEWQPRKDDEVKAERSR